MARAVGQGKPIVIVIDDTPLRRKAMAEAFEGIADVQVAYHNASNKKVRRRSAKGDKLDALGPALLILRHFRDQKIDPEIKTVLTVFYGGNGGSDPDRPEGDPEVIWRQVNAGSGTLSSAEASELLVYATAIHEGTARPKKPTLLQHAYDPVLLPAISILCQGYLAVHAVKLGGEWGPPGIKSALTHMKLPSFFEASRGDMNQLMDSLPKKRDLVSSPEWWKSVLPGNKKKAEKQIADELEVNTFDECGILKQLLDEIYGDDAVSPSVVAGAYCAVATKLTGEPCKHG
jgi:hypothetical protein